MISGQSLEVVLDKEAPINCERVLPLSGKQELSL
ncbi:uncharacterized protein METZ01_LOCUS221918 [marine metagenome]|uniref:Uncharacterized protein n=1 Tax=marine metagenome TaxID=408172 RepID=A0A382G378_9ZZZZ